MSVAGFNKGGAKLHDILIDGVFGCSETYSHCVRTFNAVRIGDTHIYGSRRATEVLQKNYKEIK